MQKENGSAKNIFVSYILLFLLKKENRTVKDQLEKEEQEKKEKEEAERQIEEQERERIP
jgi:hypothetical protein